jgi:hypothetical protein
MSGVSVAIRKQVPTVPQALAALVAMERQLLAAKTYESLRRIIKEATALKVLMSDVAEVKAAAEDAVLIGNRRIAEELRKVPKASGRPTKKLPAQGKNKTGRAATGIKHSTRSRLGKLADKSVPEIKATAASSASRARTRPYCPSCARCAGRQEEAPQEARARTGQAAACAAEKKFGVILADPEWRFETWSEETGSDRAAANHYPVTPAQEIMKRPVREIAADDCVLFLGDRADAGRGDGRRAGVGFRYVSHFVWNKNRVGTGYWNRNKHELLLIGRVASRRRRRPARSQDR